MEKKHYMSPLSEVMHLEMNVMKELGPASLPSQNFAPPRRTEVF